MSTAALFIDANLRAPTYYVARSNAHCRHCGLRTRLWALAVPRTHETLEDGTAVGDAGAVIDDAGAEAAQASDAWQCPNVNAILFYVEALPQDVQFLLQQIAPGFRPAQSAAIQARYWVNHCEHCGATLEDHELHCEPDGAFLPSSEAAAARIQLRRIQEPFEALSGGYSPDPPYFGLMRVS